VQGQQSVVYGRIEQLWQPRGQRTGAELCYFRFYFAGKIFCVDFISRGNFFTWKLVCGRDNQFADFAVIFIREHICVYSNIAKVHHTGPQIHSN
jgi:hypothetical protein